MFCEQLVLRLPRRLENLVRRDRAPGFPGTPFPMRRSCRPFAPIQFPSPSPLRHHHRPAENLRAGLGSRDPFPMMDYLTSTIQDYQPILVGAGCLALGYMYGRHCRSVMENQVDAPTTSDAACCAQTESFNYISDPAAVDSKTMAVKRPASCPSELDLDYSERELTEKPERCAKRDLGQLEIFDAHFFHKIPRKKEDTICAQTAFKRQKSASLRREVVRTKAEPEQDSDDEILAQRLEYFTKSASGTRASINKPRESDLLKLGKKKKPAADVTTSCEAKSAQDITTNSQKILPKGVARSLSGLGALATPLDDDDQGESSLEDTCRSPKTVCLDCCAGDDDVDEQDVLERGCQVELTNSAPQTETVTLPCAKSSTKSVTINYTVGNDPLEEDLGNDMSVGLMDSDDHTVLLTNEADDSPDARMEVDAHKDADTAMLQSRQDFTRLALPTSPPPELLHVQDRCVGEEEVPMDKVLKAEIYSLLHAADCGKVSFEEIVSLLEAKLKVVLRKDKAHLVSLVREVIGISKLLEEEKALEASEQAQVCGSAGS